MHRGINPVPLQTQVPKTVRTDGTTPATPSRYHDPCGSPEDVILDRSFSSHSFWSSVLTHFWVWVSVFAIRQQRYSCGSHCIVCPSPPQQQCCSAEVAYFFDVVPTRPHIPGRRPPALTLDQEFRCYNGTCFSPDGRTMYAAETPLQKISRYDYDPETGDISNKRVFVELEASRE